MRDYSDIRKRCWVVVAITLLFLMANPCAVLADSPLPDMDSFQISPSEIQIGALYHGEQLKIDINSLPDEQIALKLEGKRESIKLSKKGKVYFLWMTVGEIVFHNTPQVYLIYASRKLEKLGSDSERLRLGLGYTVLEKQVQIEGSSQERQESFGEFVKMKEHEKLYGIHDEPFPTGSMKDGARHVVFNLDIPSTIPAGEYTIELYRMRGGKILAPLSKNLTIKKTGLVSYISDLAYNHAKLYGGIAVALAVMIGVLIGLLFGLLRRK